MKKLSKQPEGSSQPAPPEHGTVAPGTSWPGRVKSMAPLLVIAAFTFVFFAPFFVQGKVFLAADTLYTFHPWKSHAPRGFQPHNMLITDPVNMTTAFTENWNQALKQGRFMTWNPNVLGGVPFFQGRSYPPAILLHRLFSTPTALTLMIVLHLFLAGWFMYLYLKEIGAGSRGAIFGAVAFMFNGCAMVWLSFETVIPNAAYMPLLLLIMERFQGGRRFFWAFLGAAVLGLVCLIGTVQYLIYISLMLVFYAAFLMIRAVARKASPGEIAALAGCCAVMAGGGALIGVMEIVPTLEVIRSSSRAARMFDFEGFFNTLGRVPWRSYVTLVFPDYFGSPMRPFSMFVGPRLEYTNFNELCLYAGVPALFALIALAVRPKSAHARYFLLLAAFVAAMMAGSFVFRPFFAWYPGMDKLNPMRMIFLFVFALAAAAGLGVRNLEELTPKQRNVFIALAAVFAALVAVLAFASSRPGLISFFHGDQVKAMGQSAALYQARLAGLRSPASAVMLKPLLLTLASAALFVLYAAFRRRRFSAIALAAATALLGYDLVSFGWGYNTLVTRDMVFARTPSIAFLQQQPGPFRVILDTGRGLYVNSMVPFGIQEIGGYQSVYPERVNKLTSFIEYGPSALRGLAFDRWVKFRNILHPFFDFLNVRYVLTAPGVRVPEASGYRLVFSGDMSIYENTRALPRAFAVHRFRLLGETGEILRAMASPDFDPRREVILEQAQSEEFVRAAAGAASAPAVTVASYDFDEVRIAAELSAPGWVVLADSHYPGWVATVDGKETPILRADCALRAVAAPAGKHEVVFRYRPASLRRVRLISLAGFLLVAAGAVFSARARRVRS